MIAFLAGEIYLRYEFRDPPQRWVLPPNYLAYYTPTPGGTPGVQLGQHRFITNEVGLRSDPVPHDNRRIIYVMGGSTSIDVWLDQSDAWPAVLQNLLNARPGKRPSWVANISKWGLSSINHIMHFNDVVPYLPKPDIVVVLDGVNDMQRALKTNFPGDITPEFEEQIAYQYIPPAGGFWTHFGYYRLYKRVQEIVHKLDTGPLLGGGADLYLPLRQCRQQIAPDHLVTAYPDIKNGLEAFRGNLNQIVDRSEAMGAHVILATQPSIWQKDMPPETAKLLLSGAIGFFSSWENCNDAHYYAPETLESALHQFNKVTMSVCRERSVTCVDLENLIPKSADYYFDDMHYTERGAHLVARYVADAVTDDNRVGHVTTKVGD